MGHLDVHADSTSLLQEPVHALRCNIARIGRGCEQAEDKVIALLGRPINKADAPKKVMQDEETEAPFGLVSDPLVSTAYLPA